MAPPPRVPVSLPGHAQDRVELLSAGPGPGGAAGVSSKRGWVLGQ